VIQPLLVHRPDDWTYLLGLAERLREHIMNLPAALLDRGFCHGDSHGANAHRDGDTVTIFDFDCCGPGWRAYDLATFRWIWEWHDAEAAAKHWSRFLQGYREYRTLADLDLAAVEPFVGLREFWLLGLHARLAAVYGSFLLADDSIDTRLDFLRRWEQEHSEPPSA
jgi:Ser/Thr protein kinase RdoA (MazF antagonist)